VFFEPGSTQFDVTWRLLRTPIRIHPWFWIMSIWMGWDFKELGFSFVFLWVVCVLVSILVHEFGHVFMGRWFGADGYIVLHAFGGLAVGSAALPNRWQRIAVSLAGPAAGFLLYGLVRLVGYNLDFKHLTPQSLMTLEFLKWINLTWGVLNLLPLWPLDGGQVSRELCQWLNPERGVRIALGITIGLAGLLALNCFYIHTKRVSLPLLDQIPYLDRVGGMGTGLLFAFLAFNAFQALQAEQKRDYWG
jgi:Zn-dependent protease